MANFMLVLIFMCSIYAAGKAKNGFAGKHLKRKSHELAESRHRVTRPIFLKHSFLEDAWEDIGSTENEQIEEDDTKEERKHGKLKISESSNIKEDATDNDETSEQLDSGPVGLIKGKPGKTTKPSRKPKITTKSPSLKPTDEYQSTPLPQNHENDFSGSGDGATASGDDTQVNTTARSITPRNPTTYPSHKATMKPPKRHVSSMLNKLLSAAKSVENFDYEAVSEKADGNEENDGGEVIGVKNKGKKKAKKMLGENKNEINKDVEENKEEYEKYEREQTEKENEEENEKADGNVKKGRGKTIGAINKGKKKGKKMAKENKKDINKEEEESREDNEKYEEEREKELKKMTKENKKGINKEEEENREDNEKYEEEREKELKKMAKENKKEIHKEEEENREDNKKYEEEDKEKGNDEENEKFEGKEEKEGGKIIGVKTKGRKKGTKILKENKKKINKDEEENKEEYEKKEEEESQKGNDEENEHADKNEEKGGENIIDVKNKGKKRKKLLEENNKEISKEEEENREDNEKYEEEGTEKENDEENETENVNESPTGKAKIEEDSEKRILCVGDSITEGYHKKGAAFYPYSKKLYELLNAENNTVTYNVYNEGVSGECVYEEMTKRMPAILEKYKPLDLVIILGGTNDLNQLNCSEETLFENIKSLHEMAHKAHAKTAAITIPDSNVPMMPIRSQSESTWKNVNEKIREYAQGRDDVILCDLAEELPYRTMDEDERAKYWDDNLHYTPKGYDRMGEIVYDAVQGSF